MAKKIQPEIVLPKDHIIQRSFATVLDDAIVPYAVMTLKDRAIPDIRDGLKPSQRRILQAMNDLSLSPSAKTRKSAKIAGDCVGNYHPHGDAAVYQTMVRLTQDWLMRYPLIDGQGNFGTADGDEAASARYTETRLSKAGDRMLRGLHAKTVPHEENYDGTRIEAKVLPSMLPNLICNGGSGIAVGWTCSMAPHNLREVVSVIKEFVKRKGVLDIDALMGLMPGPDFPTGGKLMGQDGVRSYYETGRGTVTVEGIYEIDLDARGRSVITITQFPFGGSVASFGEQVKTLLEQKQLTGLADVKTLSAKGKTKVLVEVERNASPQVLLNQLLKRTCLRLNFSVNTNVVEGDQVRTNVPMLGLVSAFVNHRKLCIQNELNTELGKIIDRIHIIEGLRRAGERVDSLINIIRKAESREAAGDDLIAAGISQSKEQSKAILALSLGSLTKIDTKALEDEQAKHVERKAWISQQLSDDNNLLKLVVKEQEELSKALGDDRRTEICAARDDLELEDLIPVEQIAIVLTKDGYIKRVPLNAYKVQGRGGKGVKGVSAREQDEASDIFVGSTHDHILFFTASGLMYRKKGHQIPMGQRNGKGWHLANLLKLDQDDKVAVTLSVKDFDEAHNLVFGTRRGMVKRTALSEYDSSRKNVGLTAIGLKPGDELAFVELTTGDNDVVVLTANGMAARYNESAIRSTGRITEGVKVMNLAVDDSVAQLISLKKDTNPDILVVTAYGYGKRSNAGDYRTTSGRDTKGVKTIDTVKRDRNGLIVAGCTVSDEDTLMILTQKGKIIRIPVAEVKAKGRTTMGMHFVNLDDNDEVAAICKAPLEELEDPE